MKALVLSGGGAKGAYQIGAWKALDEANETFDIVTGTSIGAFNGAFYVQRDYERVYRLWTELTVDQVLNIEKDHFDHLMKLNASPQNFFQRMDLLYQMIVNRGLDVSPFKKMLQTNIDEKKVRESQIKFGIVTVSVSDFKPLELTIDDIPEGKLHDYLMGSANLPIFDVDKIDGKRLIDGGFYDNTPINLAKKMGAKEITIIDLKAIGFNQPSVDVNTRIVSPNIDLGGMLSVDIDLFKNNLELGYLDTKKMLGSYSGIQYYITSSIENDRYYLDQFLSMDSDCVQHFKVLYRKTGMNNTRFIVEVLLPEVFSLLSFGDMTSYRELYFAIFEQVALDLGIYTAKERTLDELREEIARNYKPGNTLALQIHLIDRLLIMARERHSGVKIKLFNTIYEGLER